MLTMLALSMAMKRNHKCIFSLDVNMLESFGLLVPCSLTLYNLPRKSLVNVGNV